MDNQARIKDKSSLHRYRTELPNMIVDSDLSVYAFRLYVHLKRRAGDDGSCWEGTRKIADACRMSMGQVSKAKQELLDKNLITKTTRKTRGGNADEIAIVDMWPENFRKYSKDESVHTVNTSEEPFTSRTLDAESVHHMNTSGESVHTVNVKRSPHEQEEELKKKNIERVGVATKVAKPLDELSHALFDLCLVDPDLAPPPVLSQLRKTYKSLRDKEVTQGDIRERFAAYWYSDDNWMARKAREAGRNPEPPTPEQVLKEWARAMAWKPAKSTPTNRQPADLPTITAEQTAKRATTGDAARRIMEETRAKVQAGK